MKRKKTRSEVTNPVARAIANHRLTTASTKSKIKIWMMSDGEVDRAFLSDMTTYFSIVLFGAQHSALGSAQVQSDGSTYDGMMLMKLVDDALVAIVEMCESEYRFMTKHVAVLDDALDAGVILAKAMRAESVNHALEKIAIIRQRGYYETTNGQRVPCV